MKGYISVLILIMGLVFFTSPAQSEVIYESGTINLTEPGPYSDFDSPHQIGSTFLLQANQNTITDVHWWGYYSLSDTVPTQDNFTIRIFNMVETFPEQNPTVLNINVGAVQRADSGFDLVTEAGFRRDLYEYFVYIDPLLLDPDTNYVLSIVNDTTETSGDWSWARSNTPGRYFHRTDDEDSWKVTTNNYVMAFQLTNDIPVPEPSTILLFGAGLAGVGLLRRRFNH
jgi:hypothetical protein